MLDDYDPAKHGEKLPLQRIRELGFNNVRFAPETYMKQETANLMDDFRKEGIVLFGGGADRPQRPYPGSSEPAMRSLSEYLSP